MNRDETSQALAAVSIRPARDDDSDALNEIERLCPQGETAQYALLRANYADRSRQYGEPPSCQHLLTVDAEDRPIAIVGLAIRRCRLRPDNDNASASPSGEPVRVAYFYDMRVHPDHRRRGHAAHLLAAAFDVAREQGATFGTLWIEADNEASLGLLGGVGGSILGSMRVPVALVRRRVRVPGGQFAFAFSRVACGDDDAADDDPVTGLLPAETPASVAFRRSMSLRLDGDAGPGALGRIAVLGRQLDVGLSASVYDPTSVRRITLLRSPRLAAWLRPALTVGGWLGGWPRLPRVGEAVPDVMMHDVRVHASEGRDEPAPPRLARALLRALAEWLRARRASSGEAMPTIMQIPLQAGHPALPAFERTALHTGGAHFLTVALDGGTRESVPALSWPIEFDPRDF